MFDKPLKKPVSGDYDRRWLSDDYFDLIVWYTRENGIYGIQLCYDKPYWERALTWISGKGFSHMEVDDGELNAWGSQTPILVPDGSFPADIVVAEFRRRAIELPSDLRDIVLDKLDEYIRTRKV
jgi:hypothetical protein